MLEINDFILYCIVLCCVVLYCIVLYCIVLYCIVLYCIVLYCIVLCCVALRCVALRCVALRCIALHCIALHCIIVSYRIVSYRIVSYRVVSYRIVVYFILFIVLYYTYYIYCIVLYCTVLYCTILYCIVLYCTALYCNEVCTIVNRKLLYIIKPTFYITQYTCRCSCHSDQCFELRGSIENIHVFHYICLCNTMNKCLLLHHIPFHLTKYLTPVPTIYVMSFSKLCIGFPLLLFPASVPRILQTIVSSDVDKEFI